MLENQVVQSLVESYQYSTASIMDCKDLPEKALTPVNLCHKA